MADASAPRLRQLFDEHFDFVWRSLRRLGVAPGEVDDAAQEVFIVLNRKLEQVVPGSEASFLFGTCLRVASVARRSAKRTAHHDSTEEGLELPDPGVAPDTQLAEARRRQQLDAVLEVIPDEIRAVFVLYELEEMTAAQIAAYLQIPPGTVASRLRRGRELFESQVKRLQARSARVEQA